MAFRKGKQYGHKQNAIYHLHTLYGLSLDLKDFFPSITADKVYTLFSSIGYSNFSATILTNLCTLDGKLPQGGVCSPAISNIVCIMLDRRLIGLCEKRGIRFTRYADDMYFSCDDKILLLKTWPIIKKIIEDEGFVINKKKTHFHTPSNKKQITGITITTNNKDITELKAPRKIKQKIRAEIFQCIVTGDYRTKYHILGEISYVNFIERDNKIPYLKRIIQYISKFKEYIELFPELVDEYNKNIFFKELNPIEKAEIKISNIDDYYYYKNIFLERKNYLNKNGLDDICGYSNWPHEIVNQRPI